MRIAPSLLVLFVASPALAEDGKGVSLDFGYVRNQVAVTDQTVLPGELARFAVHVSLGRHFHFGAEAEEGRVTGSTTRPDGTLARTSTDPPIDGPLEGNTLGLKAFAGVHANAGAFRFGADVAGGMRDTWVSGDQGMDIAGRKNEPLLELRSRVDLWLSKTMTLGAFASTDVIERRDVAAGLLFALHFTRD